MEKQVYKLKLEKKWRIYNVFYISLLEQDIIKKRGVDETTSQLKYDKNGNKKYKFKVIYNSIVYTRKSKGHLPT